MDVLAVREAGRYAKEWALTKGLLSCRFFTLRTQFQKDLITLMNELFF
jgi:hypothetical protein